MSTKTDLFGYLSFKFIAAVSYLLAAGSLAKKRILGDSQGRYANSQSK